VSVVGDAANVINPYSHIPVYRQLADILRQQIQGGEFGHLDVLPSEKALVQTYGVGRDTVRSAIALLRDEGLVFTVPHRGTYVGPRPE